MDAMVIGLLIAIGAGAASVIGATTAYIQRLTHTLTIGSGDMEMLLNLKRLKLVRFIAIVVVILDLVAVLLIIE